MRNLKRNVYIDALALIPDKKSGIGYTIEQTLINLTKQKDSELYNFILLTPLLKASKVNKYRSFGFKVKTIPLPSRAFSFLLRYNLLPPLDLLIGKGIYIFPNYRNWSLWNSRSITYIYDIGYIKFPETVEPKNQKYLSKKIQKWANRTDKIIAITKEVSYEIEKYLHQPYSKIEIVYCGVDTKYFYKRTEKEVEKVKSYYGIDAGLYILFVGNIEPRKNLETLLDAYKKLDNSLRSKYALVIVGGDGWLNTELHVRLKEMQENGFNIIRPSSYVRTEDLPAIYSGSKLLVHPAVYEGFGITPLEALACQVPVVASDIPALKEVFSDAITYFPTYDSSKLAIIISDVLNDSKNVVEKVNIGLSKANELSWANSAEALLKIIEEEFKFGRKNHPIITRLKLIYKKTDNSIRVLLGESAINNYVIPELENTKDLRVQILKNFKKEQPTFLQLSLLKAYLYTKHKCAQLISQIVK
jgi:glycosyltransferase involved in cell wall biosynthesis